MNLTHYPRAYPISEIIALKTLRGRGTIRLKQTNRDAFRCAFLGTGRAEVVSVSAVPEWHKKRLLWRSCVIWLMTRIVTDIEYVERAVERRKLY